MDFPDKTALRKALREKRREHVAALDPRVKALLFLRPPAAITALIPEGATIGVYSALAEEAPATSYAKWFHEAGHPVALPWFAAHASPMEFRHWDAPWLYETLAPGPYRALQPESDTAAVVVPDVLFVPLVGFTAEGHRLGQGGGHYDRWLARNPDATPIGLAWDCQLAESLPMEEHDRPLAAVITPTRLYGPWERDQ